MKIAIPLEFKFKTNFTICIEHINYGNHLGNDRLVSILHEARVRFLKSRGSAEIRDDKSGLVVTALAVEYKKEAFHGDLLEIHVAYEKKGPCTGIFFYKLLRGSDTIAHAMTEIAFFNYATRKVVRGDVP